MDKLNWPRGLIRYTSENTLNGKKSRLVKPKTIAYGVVLLAAIAALAWSVATRSIYNVAIEQIRQPLSVVLSDGRIQNSYEIKLNNKIMQPIELNIALEGLPGAELDLGNLETIALDSQQRLRVLARVRIDPAAIDNTQHPFEFVITPLAGLEADPVRRPALFYMQK